jgi:fumarate reductase flavoprotein subunit
MERPVHVPWPSSAPAPAGSTAAIALRDAGIECLLLERDAQPSGSQRPVLRLHSRRGTRVQAAQGIADSAGAFAEDIQHKARGNAAPHLVRAYAEAAAPAIDAWRTRPALRGAGQLSSTRPHAHRMHTLPQRTGAALVAALLAARPVRVPTCSPRRASLELWVDRRTASWASACSGPAAPSSTWRATLLLLACNGFGGNPALVRELLPEMRDATFAGHAGNDGSACSGARRWAPPAPTWAATRATAPGWCRRARS